LALLLLLTLGNGRVAAGSHVGLLLMPVNLRMRCPSHADEQHGREQKPEWVGQAHDGGSNPLPSRRPEL
jgi:hypothetical protein